MIEVVIIIQGITIILLGLNQIKIQKMIFKMKKNNLIKAAMIPILDKMLEKFL